MPRLRLNTLALAVIAPAIGLSTAAFGYAAYVRLYSTILEGFDRKLAALSSATSAYIDTDEMLALLALEPGIAARGEDPERHPTYLKYVRPMRRIRDRAGLTFLYTQMIPPGRARQCVYVLDGTVGPGHSRLGSVDTIPDADWDAALRVIHDGEVVQTAIRPWEQWGLLKCGWAPMYGADGTIRAMAGADVEITVIRQKTYAALLQTLGAGALALMLASVVSVRVARRLTHPLGEVREAALRIAGGDHRVRCRVGRPREMQTLAGTVNALAGMMTDSVEQGQQRTATWRGKGARRALIQRLAIPPYRSPDLAIAILPGRHAAGYVTAGPFALLWQGRREPDELAARKTARDIERITQRLLFRHGRATPAHVQHFLGERLLACALINLQAWSIDVFGDHLGLTLRGPAESTDSQTVVAPGTIAVVTPAALAARTVDAPAADPDALLDFLLTGPDAADGGIVAVLRRPDGSWRERNA